MNIVDLIIILFVLLFAFSGYRKGALRQLLSLVSLVASFLFAIYLYTLVGDYISSNWHLGKELANPIGFFVAWFLAQFVINIITHFIYPIIPEGLRKSKINRFAGAIPGFLWGVVFVVMMVLIASVMPLREDYRKAIDQSSISNIILDNSGFIKDKLSNLASNALGNTIEFLTIKPDSGETVDLGFRVPEEKLSVDSQSEEEMLKLVNIERKKRGLKPLIMDNDLRSLARAQSKDMFIRGYFAHVNPDGKDPFERMKEAGIKFIVAGENLALAPNVNLAHDGLMNSPGHRANILTAEYAKVGIGCIDGGPYGKMFSQEFTD